MYLASMAIIGGARTVDGVTKAVKAGFAPLMKVCAFSPSFCRGNLDLRFVGDLHQLASSANIRAEVPSIRGKAIDLVRCMISYGTTSSGYHSSIWWALLLE